MNNATITPAVGLYANHIGWTDVRPFEILAVSKSGSVITIREMSATRDPNWTMEAIPGGFCAHVVNNHTQEWIIEADEGASVRRAHRRKDGHYYSDLGQHVVADAPQKFHDYNF